MKSILVIGMGRFGRHLATRLQDLGNDVMIVDKNEEIINELEVNFTNSFIGDCTNPSVLKRLGVNNFDICIVAIGDNFQSSLEITSLLHEMNAKFIVSKADRDMQAKFLSKNGADEVIYLERDMADRLAIKYNSKNIVDYFELGKNFAIIEIPVLEAWVGKSISELDIRNSYNINILAVKVGKSIEGLPSANYHFKSGDHVIIVGQNDCVFKVVDKR